MTSNKDAPGLLTVKDVTNRFAIITIDTSTIRSSQELQQALIGGTVELVQEMTRSAHQRQMRVALDVRASSRPRPTGADGTLMAAVRALVQAYIRENGASIPPVNIVITNDDQEADRETTWRFLAHPDGGMARGATFDLRRSPA